MLMSVVVAPGLWQWSDIRQKQVFEIELVLGQKKNVETVTNGALYKSSQLLQFIRVEVQMDPIFEGWQLQMAEYKPFVDQKMQRAWLIASFMSTTWLLDFAAGLQNFPIKTVETIKYSGPLHQTLPTIKGL